MMRNLHKSTKIIRRIIPGSTSNAGSGIHGLFKTGSQLCRYKNSLTLLEFKSASAKQRELPVLTSMINKILSNHEIKPYGEETLLIYLHHAVESSATLLEKIFELGIAPHNTYVFDKFYSRSDEVVKEIERMGVNYIKEEPSYRLGQGSKTIAWGIYQLWQFVLKDLKAKRHIKQILILDHGGYATELLPNSIAENYKVIVIPKTTSDLIRLEKEGGSPQFPYINVPRCAIKKHIESLFIAETIINKLESIIKQIKHNSVCVIVGYGAIGEALAKHLKALNELKLKIIIHDTDLRQLDRAGREKFITASNLSAASVSADYIFCCALGDISKELMELLNFTPNNVNLINCGSEDAAFLFLLRKAQQEINKKHGKNYKINPLETVEYKNEHEGIVKIISGGFPVNFNSSGISVPNNDIQLTRGLVLGAVTQAATVFKRDTRKISGIIQLDSEIQLYVFREWLKYRTPNHLSIEENLNLDWIQKNSDGVELSDLTNPLSCQLTRF